MVPGRWLAFSIRESPRKYALVTVVTLLPIYDSLRRFVGDAAQFFLQDFLGLGGILLKSRYICCTIMFLEHYAFLLPCVYAIAMPESGPAV
jgi:hypothetical protein